MDYATSLYLTGAEIGLSISGLVLLLVSAWGGARVTRIVTILAAAALFGAAIFTGHLFTELSVPAAGDAFGGLYRADDFSSFAKILIYLAVIACLMITPKYLAANGIYRSEYPILLLFGAVGMSMMVSAVDLITLYIGLELSSLSSYVLASFARDDARSSEAGLKYFILGALASGILLYGMSLIYGFAGTTDYAAIRLAFIGGIETGALFGIVFVLAGLAFKIAAVPFHMWTPDVYEGAPTPVTAFFASAPKVAAVAILMRIALEPFADHVDSWRQIVVFAALASIVVGALGAIGQESLKRLLAYSSINNVGFILIGLATATQLGTSAMMTYLVIYVVMTLGSFTALLMLRDEDGRPFETFSDIAGLATRKPAIAWCLLLLMFSLAGIPPLFGFWAKFVVFRAAVEADLITLAAIGIAASVIGAFYYLKFVKVMFFDEAEGSVVKTSPIGQWIVLILAGIVVSPLGYFLNGLLDAWSSDAAASLFYLV